MNHTLLTFAIGVHLWLKFSATHWSIVVYLFSGMGEEIEASHSIIIYTFVQLCMRAVENCVT